MREILIADDDPHIRRMLVRILRFHGYSVIATDTGSKVLDLCLQFKPRLILLDMMIPGMDGKRVMGLLKDRLGDAAPPVILVTASWLPNDMLSEIGAAAYLQKPFTVEHILSLVGQYATENSSYRRSG